MWSFPMLQMINTLSSDTHSDLTSPSSSLPSSLDPSPFSLIFWWFYQLCSFLLLSSFLTTSTSTKTTDFNILVSQILGFFASNDVFTSSHLSISSGVFKTFSPWQSHLFLPALLPWVSTPEILRPTQAPTWPFFLSAFPLGLCLFLFSVDSVDCKALQSQNPT